MGIHIFFHVSKINLTKSILKVLIDWKNVVNNKVITFWGILLNIEKKNKESVSFNYII